MNPQPCRNYHQHHLLRIHGDTRVDVSHQEDTEKEKKKKKRKKELKKRDNNER